MKNTPILSSELMRQCDDYTIHTLGVPSQVLMERAAQGVIDYLATRADLFPVGSGRGLVLCGGGNNGGDGFAVARFLHEMGLYEVSVCYGGRMTEDGSPDTAKMSVECARQYELLRALPVKILPLMQAIQTLPPTDVIIDALFGIGLDRPITGDLASLISAVNQSGIPVLAVDIPSGIHSDSGHIMGTAIQATATVTMQALKIGLLCYPGADHAGHIHVCDINIDLSSAETCRVHLADEGLLQNVLPPHIRRSHKGTYGQLGMICGSHGMAGAAILSARGALRVGAGLVRVITSEDNREILQISVPEAVVTCYDPISPISQELMSLQATCDGLVMGCGFGTSTASAALLGAILDACPIRRDFPVVLDADALNLFSKRPHLWGSRLLTEGASQVIITPHPAEMSRLTGRSVQEILDDPLTAALSFAKSRGITVVLKDAHTVIAAPDGQAYLCPFGNAGMAKGGGGDVLAGIIGGLAVQCRRDLNRDLSPSALAAAGVVLHAMAGDLASQKLGEYSMTPTDLISEISSVIKSYTTTQTFITHS